ncbi:MAG: ATP-binding cassette domain-containing protein [Microbacteriaceae bacterium]
MNEDNLAVLSDDLTIGFTKRAETPVIEGLTLNVRRNEFFVLTGPTGSGKSTFLRVLAANNARKDPKILGGDLMVLGRDLGFLIPRARYRLQTQLGYLPQDGAMLLAPQFTVAENIVLPITSRDRHWDKTDLSRRVLTLLEQLALPKSLASHYPHELSSGQRQRVALAQSVIFEPKLWLIDDPTRGVDVIAREAVLSFITERKRSSECTIILATTEPTVLRDLTDRVAVLDEGKLADIGDTETILTRPQSFFMQDYLALLD